MPESDDRNSSWNRRKSLSSDSEIEREFHAEIENVSIENDSSEDQYQSDFDSNSSDDDLDDYDFSLQFEDYAPAWFLKIKSLYGTDPEWLLAATFGVIAIVLTITLLLSAPDGNEEYVSAAMVAPVPQALETQPDVDLINSRITLNAPDPLAFVEVGTSSLLVAFGEITNRNSEVVIHNDDPFRLDVPLKRPEFKPVPESISEPSIVMNIQKIRIIESEILEPGIDQDFFVKARPAQSEMQRQLVPQERLLFDQNWRLVNLARTEAQLQQNIRPTLYHERVSGGKHLQVGQEEPMDRSQLDRLSRATIPQSNENINLEIRKIIPQNGIAQNLLTYSILITNQGKSSAYDVQVNELLSPDVSLVDVLPRAEVNQNNLSWKIARLDPDQEREFQVKVFLNQAGRVKTNSIIKLASKVSASTEITTPRIEVEMKGPEVVAEGEIFPIEFVVSNQGRKSQHEVSLNLDLPDGLEHDQGRQLTLKINQLAPDESRTFSARVKATKSGALTSQAILATQGITFDPVKLKQKVIERTPDSVRMPVSEKKPDNRPTPVRKEVPVVPAVPVKSCPCQPVYYPVLYLIP